MLEYLSLLGYTIKRNNPFKQRFLGVLDETGIKLEKITQFLKLNSNALSQEEIQGYERYISSLTFLIIKENSEISIYLVKTILKKIKIFVILNKMKLHTENQRKTDIIFHICKNLRNELIMNKGIFNQENQYCCALYKLMKYEDMLRPVF